jgi:hypothetical protein
MLLEQYVAGLPFCAQSEPGRVMPDLLVFNPLPSIFAGHECNRKVSHDLPKVVAAVAILRKTVANSVESSYPIGTVLPNITDSHHKSPIP